MEAISDEGFVNAISNIEELMDDVDDTLDRVEKIEGDAEEAVREANEALTAVDNRLQKFDETISLLEAKIEAAFSIGFFFFALNNYLAGEYLLAAGLFAMGLLGASSLAVTIVTMPQVRRLVSMSRYATGREDPEDDQAGEHSKTEETNPRETKSDTEVNSSSKRKGRK